MIYAEESYQIVGAMIEVFNQLGCGFLEKVYQEALAIEFDRRFIPFEKEKHLPIYYKGEILEQEYIADFVCFDKIIVELKAVEKLQGTHQAQVINYLKITGFQLGILANFGEQSLNTIRLVR